jgi:hypothetical protein
MSQIRNIEPSAKLSAERFRQNWQQTSSIPSSDGAALFKLNDMPANLPAGLNLNGVDGPQSLLTGTLDQFPKTMEEIVSTWVSTARFV